MFGISGTALGAILRATGKDYKEISAVGGVYAAIVAVISLIVLMFGTTLETLISWIPETLTFGLTAGIGLSFVVALLVGVSAFVSLLIGAIIIDISEAIIKGI